MVTTKGERYQLVKKDEAEDMKKTYVNLKPARKYRFHWRRLQSRESSYRRYCLHFNLFCIFLSWAAGFFCPLQWVEGDIRFRVQVAYLSTRFFFPPFQLYAFVQTVECSSISRFLIISSARLEMRWFFFFLGGVMLWTVHCALWKSRAYLLLPSQPFWCCTDIVLIYMLLHLVQEIYIFIIIISKVICHVCISVVVVLLHPDESLSFFFNILGCWSFFQRFDHKTQ